MSNLFQRIFVQVLTKLGSESTVIQRAAQKAARMQYDFTHNTLTPASEKAGVWAGAAAREVYLDIKAATAYLRNASPPPEPGKQEAPHKSESTSAGFAASKGQKSDQQWSLP